MQIGDSTVGAVLAAQFNPAKTLRQHIRDRELFWGVIAAEMIIVCCL